MTDFRHDTSPTPERMDGVSLPFLAVRHESSAAESDQGGGDRESWLSPLEGLRRFSELRQRLAGHAQVEGEKAAWASIGCGTEIFFRRAIQVVARGTSCPPSIAHTTRDFFTAFASEVNPLMQAYVCALSQVYSLIQECVGGGHRDAAYLALALGSISLGFPKTALWAISNMSIEHGLPEEACGTILRVLLISEGQATLDTAVIGTRDMRTETLCGELLEAVAGDWTDSSARFEPILKAASFNKSWDEFLRSYRL